jgi:hypothetical protein
MRRVILFSLVALSALAGGAYALAGSPSQGMKAFALVDPNGGSPRLVDAHTNGFVSVSVGPFGPGDYCLTPAPGVDVTHTAAIASEEAFTRPPLVSRASAIQPPDRPAAPAGWR